MLGFRPIKTNICLNIIPRNNYFLEDNPVNDGEIEIIDKVQDFWKFFSVPSHPPTSGTLHADVLKRQLFVVVPCRNTSSYLFCFSGNYASRGLSTLWNWRRTVRVNSPQNSTSILWLKHCYLSVSVRSFLVNLQDESNSMHGFII